MLKLLRCCLLTIQEHLLAYSNVNDTKDLLKSIAFEGVTLCLLFDSLQYKIS